MARHIPIWGRRYPNTIAVLERRLPAIERAEPKVWRAFLSQSTLDAASASAALSFNTTPPLLWFDELGGIDGQFQPSAPGRIKINAEVARQLEHQPEAQLAQRYLCGKVLHEMVHWARFQRGESEPEEMGLVFETEAYDEVLPRFWGGVANSTATPAPTGDVILDHGLPTPGAPAVGSSTLTAALPRGIRNNNPGNIKRSATRWEGLASFDEMVDFQRREQVFCVFKAPEWGLRAMARILSNYQRIHQLSTVAGMINRWAPVSENDTGAYVRFVCARTKVGADEAVDFTDPDFARPMLKAVIRQENGIQPYSDDQIMDGYRLALE